MPRHQRRPYLAEVTALAQRAAMIPWQAEEPVGPAALAALFTTAIPFMKTYIYETVPSAAVKLPGITRSSRRKTHQP